MALGAINSGVVILLERLLRKNADFGWFSYAPLNRQYADYLPPQHLIHGWPAVALVCGALVLVNVVVATAYAAVTRRGR